MSDAIPAATAGGPRRRRADADCSGPSSLMRSFACAVLLCCAACSTPRYEPPPEAPYDHTMNDLAIYAMSLADTPYRYGGSTPDGGLDCSGFVDYVFLKALGKSLPRTSREISRVGTRVARERLRPGDLVFFNTRNEAYSHVGIYVGEERFVHAPGSGKSISLASMRDAYWHSRYDGARRVGGE